MGFEPFGRTDLKQEITIAVEHKGETTVLPDFMLPAVQYTDVNIVESTAGNGNLTVSFDRKPAIIPQFSDFIIIATKK